MENKKNPQPPPARDHFNLVFSVILGGAIVIIVIMAFFAHKGREHIHELERRSHEPLSTREATAPHVEAIAKTAHTGFYPDAPGDDPGMASVMAMVPPEFDPSPIEDEPVDTDIPEPEPFDMSRCDKWSQDQRFDCEKFPDMPGECCLGC